MVEFGGRIYTNRYGNAGAGEDALDNDEDLLTLISVEVGPQQCDMVSFIYL